uniref:Uncharacterized protein n=1 Tax=Panagrolaimus superbus TaxID=310955 RepID=A0A914Z344_9BILA
MNGIMGYGPELFNTVQKLVVKTETKINFIQVGAYPCSELITYEGPSLMWNISSISGGDVYVISWPTVIKLMKTFPSHYQNSMISEVLFEDCSVEQIFKFPVDSQTQNINILINGELKEDPTYVNPNGDENDHSVETAYIDYTSNSRFNQIVGMQINK